MPFVSDLAGDDAPALMDLHSDRWRSYGELRAATRAVATALRADDKHLVFLAAANDWATVVALLGALDAGHAVALVDPSTSAEQLADLRARYQPELSISSSARADAERLSGDGWTLWLERSGRSPARSLHPDLGVLLSTSGSTGSPKFVRLSLANLHHNADAIGNVLRITGQDRSVGHLALHYSYGLSVLTSHLRAGAAVLLLEHGLTSRTAWDAIRGQQCTSLPGVPYHYELLRRLDLQKLDVPHLTCLTQAGGRAKPELIAHFHQQMRQRGGRFYVMYGQTEAAPRITTLPSERLPEKLGSVGLPLPDGRIEIIDDQGRPCPPGETGEVVYCGPNVMLGYAVSRSCLSKDDEMAGRLATGDLGYLDEDGFLFLTGRSSRIAKVFGVRINLDEVELQAGAELPLAAVAGNDQVRIFVEQATPAQLDAMRQTVLRRVQMQPSALRVESIDKLPLKDNGKVDYQALRATR